MTESTFKTYAKRSDNGKVVRPRLYRVWGSMRNRCLNKNAQKWHRYGQRGITICSEWDSFAEFRRWAISNGYRKGLTIDRIDNDGNYEPDNCRWITKSENSSKITPQQVRDIRADSRHVNEIAKDYGLHPSWVSRLQNNEKRTDV